MELHSCGAYVSTDFSLCLALQFTESTVRMSELTSKREPLCWPGTVLSMIGVDPQNRFASCDTAFVDYLPTSEWVHSSIEVGGIRKAVDDHVSYSLHLVHIDHPRDRMQELGSGLSKR